MIGGIDHEDFVEAVGQVVGQAHEVDRLLHRPEGRHGDEIGLHDAAGRVFGIFEAALQRDALEMRELGKDVGLLVLVEVLEQIDGFVGIELLQRLCHLLGRHVLQHLIAHPLVELGQRRGLEVVAEHGDEDAARLRTQQLDQVGEVGFMQRQRQLADFGGVALIDRRADGMQEIGADRARFVAQFDLARGVLHGLSDRRVLSFPCPDRRPGRDALKEGKWCGREESNLHGLSPQRPQRCASTNSATTAKLGLRRLDRGSGRPCVKTRNLEAFRPRYGYRMPDRQAPAGLAALANPIGGCKV